MANLTSNVNFLSPIEFKLVLNRLPNVEFFVRSANIPGISSGTTELPTPFKNVFQHGDKLSYDEFTVTIVCDEDMVSFREISDWLVAVTMPENFAQYAGLKPDTYGKGGEQVNQQGEGVTSDATLIILNSNKNSNVKVKFNEMFPIAVGSIQLDTSGVDLTPPTFDITFKYNKYTIEV